MKFVQLPSREIETIELCVSKPTWLERLFACEPLVSQTVRIAGRTTYTTGMLQLEKDDATLPLGMKIPKLKDDVSGFVMHGVIPVEVMEDGHTVVFHVDYMERA